MKASEVIERVFNYLKTHFINMGILDVTNAIAKNTVFSVCDLQEEDTLTNPLVCILPIRDAVAGQFVKQNRVSVELQLVCYTPNYYQLGGAGQLDEIVRNAMMVYYDYNPPSNFNLVRRSLSTWIRSLSAFQSKQIYQFHIIDN